MTDLFMQYGVVHQSDNGPSSFLSQALVFKKFLSASPETGF
jgi:hypothetical protein